MSITSSLFSAISGLSTNGNAMSVIGDNIANVNTVGFKSSRTTFQDVLSQSVATASGASQIGRGTTLSTVSTLFQQGSFESTTSATDLAIGGTGYFMVRQPNTDVDFYTRAGEFSFDDEGNFVNSSGYVVQGWALDDQGNNEGTIRDIVLNEFTSPPQASTSLTSITNLDSSESSAVESLFGDGWDATDLEPISDASYSYSTSIQVYDSLGNAHDVTVYFDKIDATDTNNEYIDGISAADIDNSWEYIICCNPADDMRNGTAGTSAQGVLMRGTLTYDSETGDLSNVSAYVYNGTGTATSDASWEQATFSEEGYPQFSAEFVDGVPQLIDFQEGLRNSNTSGGTNGWTTGTAANIGAITAAAGVGSFAATEPQATISTQYASSGSTIYQSQDGYGTGYLESISVDTDGVMTGNYSNGQILNLYRVALAKFNNEQGLSKAGGSLWSETRDSGPAITDAPGNNGLGTISSNSLEQSNVDLASEFVKMITIQRGYQANSRVITTVDSLLEELNNLVR